jgi:hypothetical protein
LFRKINRGTIVTAPITSVSLIEVFGDIKDFNSWAESFISAFSSAKEYIFNLIGYFGISFIANQQDILLLIIVIYMSHLAAISDIDLELKRDDLYVIRGSYESDHLDFIRPTYKFKWYLLSKSHVPYYLGVLIFSISLYPIYMNFYSSVNSAVVSQLLFSLIVAIILRNLIISYLGVFYFFDYCRKEAIASKSHLRRFRFFLEQGDISSDFYTRERNHIRRIFVKLKYDLNTTKSLFKNFRARMLFVGMNLVVILAAFYLVLS